MTEIIIMCAIFGVFIFASFITGLHYGSKVKRDEKIEIPNIVKSIKKHAEEKKNEEKREREELIEEINLKNLDVYDGTEVGQTDFPR